MTCNQCCRCQCCGCRPMGPPFFTPPPPPPRKGETEAQYKARIGAEWDCRKQWWASRLFGGKR